MKKNLRFVLPQQVIDNIIPRKTRKIRRTCLEKDEKRNWLDLPHEIMIIIFLKLDVVEILYRVQFVCSSWLKLSKEPQLFQSLIFPGLFIYADDDDDYGFRYMVPKASPDKCCSGMVISFKVLDEAVKRSRGELMKISLEGSSCTNKFLQYVACKSKKSLKSLRLASCAHINDKVLVGACRKLYLLEELELNETFSISDQAIKEVGHYCSKLKYFRFIQKTPPKSHSYSHKVAFAIAETMPKLHGLCLQLTWLTNIDLQAIREGCPLLEELDLRGCCYTDLQEQCEERSRDFPSIRVAPPQRMRVKVVDDFVSRSWH